jgi:putative membrane protein
MDWNWEHLSYQLIITVVYTLLGLLILGFSYWLINKYTVFSLHDEIITKNNMALSILLGAVVIGVALIVAAAIRG